MRHMQARARDNESQILAGKLDCGIPWPFLTRYASVPSRPVRTLQLERCVPTCFLSCRQLAFLDFGAKLVRRLMLNALRVLFSQNCKSKVSSAPSLSSITQVPLSFRCYCDSAHYAHSSSPVDFLFTPQRSSQLRGPRTGAYPNERHLEVSRSFSD